MGFIDGNRMKTLLNFSIDVDTFICPKVHEWCSEVNES